MIFLASLSILLRSRRFSLLALSSTLACTSILKLFLFVLIVVFSDLIRNNNSVILRKTSEDSVYIIESCFFFMCFISTVILGSNSHFSKFRSYTEETFARFLKDFNVDFISGEFEFLKRKLYGCVDINSPFF